MPDENNRLPQKVEIAVNRELDEQGKEILKDVKLESFEVSPQTIEPFEEGQLSWRVSGPEGKFTVRLNGRTVGATGSATVSPLKTTSYKLEAVALRPTKSLGQVTLAVNTDNCESGTIDDSLIQASVGSTLGSLVQSAGELTLRDTASEVTVDAGRIDIDAFLKLDIPNFFDADIDVALKFSLGLTAGRDVRARLVDTNVDVKFSKAEHVLSFGSAACVQGVAQEVMRVCIQAFEGPELEEDLATGLQDEIDRQCRAKGFTDFRILSLVARDDRIDFVCCLLPEEPRFTTTVMAAEDITLAFS